MTRCRFKPDGAIEVGEGTLPNKLAPSNNHSFSKVKHVAVEVSFEPRTKSVKSMTFRQIATLIGRLI